MDQMELDQLESQLAALRPPTAPVALRSVVLADVRHELRSARWDRRLARVAAVLLVVGVGLNATIGMYSEEEFSEPRRLVVQSDQRRSLIDTAVLVAEATDAATARRFARQLAAMSGRELTDAESAAIDAAAKRPMPQTEMNGKSG